jgi:hypothetical protein
MHKAKNLLIACIDFRFQETVVSWIHKQGFLGNTDFIFVAGASRDLVKPIEEAHKNSLLRQIDLSVKLHDPDTIVIIDHQDCGGYAQDKTIEAQLPLEEDQKKHAQFGVRAVALLKQRFPSKKIISLYADLTGKVNGLYASE